MEAFTKSMMSSKPVDQEFMTVVMISDYSVRQTKSNNNYLTGTLDTLEGSVPFKIWGSDQYTNSFGDLKNRIFIVSCVVDEYKDMKSIVIKAINHEVTDNSYTEADFVSSPYDKKTLQKEFVSILKNNLSEDGLTIWKTLLGKNSTKFFKEYAARKGGKNHDNVIHGLLAHSLKVTKVIDFAWGMYNLDESDLDKDLLYIGVSLHDMGKVQEYLNGYMSPNGLLVSHRSFATETLTIHRDEVISLKGEEWYYRLMSIFAQHHGEYEETPRTYEAMIVHYVDMFESSMAGVLQAYEEREENNSVWYKGFPLK